MTERTVAVGLAQILVEGGRPEANLPRAVAAIAQAAALGCRMVVLPECLDLGWGHPSAAEHALPLPGPRSEALAQAASRHGVHVAAGLVERDGQRVFNAAVLLGPDGRLLLKHRKINLLVDVESMYAVGDRLGVAATPLGTVGLNICADNFSDSLCLGHSLARMGAELIVSPSAWAVPADFNHTATPYGGLWKDAYQALASLYRVAVVGVSNVGRIDAGPWRGRSCIGCSLAVGPDEQILAQAAYGEGAEEVVRVDVPLVAPAARGTDIAPWLRGRGYVGP